MNNLKIRQTESAAIAAIIASHNKDSTGLMDILIDVQERFRFVSKKAVNIIAEAISIPISEIEQTLSFYHFLSRTPTGRYTVYLNNSAVAGMMGRDKIARAFAKEAGCKFGTVSEDGNIGLFNTPCIGMNDQEPSAIINQRVFTRLSGEQVIKIVRAMKNGAAIDDLPGSGVQSNIIRPGPILTIEAPTAEILEKSVCRGPDDVIAEVRAANLRGRGGAGFLTAMKWQLCRAVEAERRYIFCNADEGEPGTFKDRVILTERSELLFAGMVIAGYAIGAAEGVLYLRYEYKYMTEHLENVLRQMREAGLLGRAAASKKGFDFDIRLQFGGGSYVCGEESALLESAEGKRGEPRDRPPFPVEKGYLQQPTVVNNVETLCAVAKIMLKGADWYRALGTAQSTGTKLLSVSGDCGRPGIYEIEWGFTVNDILRLVDAKDVQAVQVSGPSGTCIAPKEFNRRLAYEDLATGGSMIVIDNRRDLLKDVVLNFTDFFISESCGSCVPCRAMTIQYKKKLEKILRGNGIGADIDQMLSWEKVMRVNRCGLGQTAANPILSTIRNFSKLYNSRLRGDIEFVSEFDLSAAVRESCQVSNRVPGSGGK